jgi:myo-inositol-1-phosphate synthase
MVQPTTNGNSTEGSVHPTAARRPHSIVVQSENTSYSDEFITSSFINRGAEVTVAGGQFIVNPTAATYELQTKREVSKTGYVVFILVFLIIYSNASTVL